MKNLTLASLEEVATYTLEEHKHRTPKQQADRVVRAVVDEIARALMDRRPIRFIHAFTVTPKIRKGKNYKDPRNGEQFKSEPSVYFTIGGRAAQAATDNERYRNRMKSKPRH